MDIEIWQANSNAAPYRWLIRDADPPRYWYGALDDGRGGWVFERVPDATLAEQSDDFAEPEDESVRAAVVQAFRQQVLGQSP